MVASSPLCTIAPSTTALSTATDRAFSIALTVSTAKPVSVTLYYLPDISNSDLTPETADSMKMITFPIATTNVSLASGSYTTTTFEVLLTNLQPVNYTVFGYVSAGTTSSTLVNAAGQIPVTNSGGVASATAAVTVTGTPITAANLNWAFIDSATAGNNDVYNIQAVGSTSTFTLDRNVVRVIAANDTGTISSTVLNSSPPMTAPVIRFVALATAATATVTLAADKFADPPDKVQFTIISNAQTGAHAPTALIQTFSYVATLMYTLTGLANDIVYSISAAFIKSTVTSPLSAVKYYAASSALGAVTSTSFTADLTNGSLKLSFSRPSDALYNINPVGKYVLELLDAGGLSLSPSQTFVITPDANDTDATVYSKSFANVVLGTAYKVTVAAYDTDKTIGSATYTSASAVTTGQYLYPIVLERIASAATSTLSAFFTVTPPLAGMGPIQMDAATPKKEYYWVQRVTDGINGVPAKQTIVAATTIRELLLPGATTNGKQYSYNIWPAMTGDTFDAHSPSILVTGTPYNPAVNMAMTPIVDLTVSVPSNPVTSTAVTVAWGLSSVSASAGLTPSGYEISASYTYQPGSTSNPSGSPTYITIPIYNAPAGSTMYSFNIATTEPIFVKVDIVAYVNVNYTVLRATPVTNYANQSVWDNPSLVESTIGTGSLAGLVAYWPQAPLQKVGTFKNYIVTLEQWAGSSWAAFGTPYVAATAVTTTSFVFTTNGTTSSSPATTGYNIVSTTGYKYRVNVSYVVTVNGTDITTLSRYSASATYASASKPTILSVTFDSTKKIASVSVAKNVSIITQIAMVAMCNNGTSIVPLTNVPTFAADVLTTDTFDISLTFAYPVVDCVLFAANAIGMSYGSFTA